MSDEIKAKLRKAKQKVHIKTEVVPVEIKASIRVGNEDSTYEHLTVAQALKKNKSYIFLHKGLHIPKDGAVLDGTMKFEVYRPVAQTITDAIRTYNNFLQECPTPVTPFHFLYAFCKARGVDLIQLGIF